MDVREKQDDEKNKMIKNGEDFFISRINKKLLGVTFTLLIATGFFFLIYTPSMIRPTKPIEITIFTPWGDKERENFLEVLKTFTKETGILVKYMTQPSESFMENLSTQFSKGEAYVDVIVVSWPTWITELAQKDHLMNLNDLIKDKKYAWSYIYEIKVNRDTYAIPLRAWIKPGFWYRISFFNKHGLTVPKTWEEFKTFLEKVKKIEGIEAPIASGDGVGWPLSDIAEAFIIGRGNPELQLALINGKINFTDTKIRTVFEDLLRFLQKGYFSPPTHWEEQIDKWWSGKYGIYFMGNWMTIMVPDAKDLSFFPFPETQGVVGGCDWIFIPKYTKHPKEAKLLVKYLIGYEGQKKLVKLGGFISPYKNISLEIYPPPDREVVTFLSMVKIIPDLDDTIGKNFQFMFWDNLKFLWMNPYPEKLEEVLTNLQEILMFK